LLWATVRLPWVPVPVLGSWTVLSVHVALSLLLIPLFVAHLGLRWPRPSREDLIGRRAALRVLGLLAAGFVFWRVQEVLSVLAAPSGSRRRFTGSREEGSFAGNLHPVTNWLSDPIPRVDPDRWRLRIHGEVERETDLSYEEILVLGTAVRQATLDCTGGWYTVQRWSGVPVTALLEQAGLENGAQPLDLLHHRLHPPFPAGRSRRPPSRHPRRGRRALRRARLPLEARRPGPSRVRLGQVDLRGGG